MAAIPTPQTWTIGALLTWTADFFSRKAIDEPRLSAELLLAHVLGTSRMSLYTQYERVSGDSQLAAFRELVRQRAEHVPVAYLTGEAWFFSLKFKVTRDVLIPRPDTETLVEQVIGRIRQTPGWEVPAILDLCTGSGCMAVALAKNLATSQVLGVDISAAAAKVTLENAQANGVVDRVAVLEGDLFEPIQGLNPPRRFQVIVANPPYIPTAQIAALAPTVRDHEPRLALDGGPDGLSVHRRIVSTAREFLEPGGLLALEIQYDQGVEAQGVLAAGGYLENIRLVRDAAGQARCVMGTVAKA